MPTISTKSPNFVKGNVSIAIDRINLVFRYLKLICFVSLNFLADAASNLPASVQKLQVSTAAHQKQQELLKQVADQQFVPKEAPPDFEFVADPPSISALDL